MNKKASSLVEIIVVVAIIGMLVGIVTVALGSTRKKSRTQKENMTYRKLADFSLWAAIYQMLVVVNMI